MPDALRRTHLAAERTWLAWWRMGLAAAGGAIASYVALGVGYGVLAMALMGAASVRLASAPRTAPEP